MEKTFYTAKETERERYYQLPTFLFTDDRYNHISNDAKVAYALFKTQFNYSVKNNWIDDDGHVYFVYTVKQLMSVLNCYEGKVVKVKKELEDAGLLMQVRGGIKGKVKTPTRLYLVKPQLQATDVFTIAENASTKENDNTNVKTSSDEKQVEETAKTRSSSTVAKTADNLLDFNIKKLDTYIDTCDTKQARQRQQLLQSITQDSNIEVDCLPPEAKRTIVVLSSNPQQAYEWTGLILKAKNKVAKETGELILTDDLGEDFIMTVRRVFHHVLTRETSNTNGYIYTAFRRFFENEVFVRMQLPQVEYA